MKKFNCNKLAVVLAICGAGSLSPLSRADTILFNPINTTAAGLSWSTVANWTDAGSPVVSVPNGIDSEVEFVGPGTVAGTAGSNAYTATLGSSTAVFTVGTMTLDAGTGNNENISINNGTLVFAVSSGSALLVSDGFSGTTANNGQFNTLGSTTLSSDTLGVMINSPFILDAEGNLNNRTGISWAATMCGNSTFTKIGPGNVSMTTVTKAFTGSVTINDGAIRLALAGKMGSAGNVTVNAGGQLMIDGATGGDMSFGTGSILSLCGSGVTDPLALAGGTQSAPGVGGSTTAAGALRYHDAASGSGSFISNGVVFVANGGVAPTIYVGTSGTTFALTGAISGSTGFIKIGGSASVGTLILTNPNSTYSGAVTIQQGAVSVATDGALGASPITATDDVYIYDAAALGGSGPAPFTLGSTRSIALGTPGVAAASGSSIFVSSGQSMTISGLIHDNTTAGTTGKLNVSGPGALTLAAPAGNTYSGGTSISAGALYVNNTSNSGTGTGPVTVTVGALGGSGSVSGPVTLGNGAQLSPGPAAAMAGKLSLASFANAAGATSGTTYNFEVSNVALAAGTGYDTLAVSGNADFTNYNSTNDKFNVNVIGLGTTGFVNSSPFTFTILTAGTLTGFNLADTTITSSGSLAFANLGGGTFSLSSSGNSVFVNFNPAVAPPRNLTWNAGTNTNWTTVQTDTNWINQADSSTGNYYNDGDTVFFLGAPPAGGAVVLAAGGVSPAAITVSNTGTFTFSGGPINGGTGLVKSNTGTLALTVPNNYTGGTTINGGDIAVGANTALGSSLSGVTLNGGYLQLTADVSTARVIAVTSAGGGIDTNGNNGILSPAAAISIAGTFNKIGAGDLAITTQGFLGVGPIVVSGGSLTLGDITASAPDIHAFIPATTAVTLNNATLQTVGNTTAHISIAPASLTVLGTSTVQAYNAVGATSSSTFIDPGINAPVTINGHLILTSLDSNSGYDFFSITSITLTGNSTIETTSYGPSVTNPNGTALKLTGALVDNGFTTTFLSGVNSTQIPGDFSSNIQLNGTTGNVVTGNWVLGLPDGSNGAAVSPGPTAYTTGSSVTIFNHSCLNLFSSGTYGSASQTIDVYGIGATDDAGDGTYGAITSTGTSNTVFLASNINLDSDPTVTPVYFSASANTTLTLSGNIGGIGQLAVHVANNGAGTVSLTGTNNYAGGAIVFSGTLKVASLLTNIPVAGGVTINPGATLLLADAATPHTLTVVPNAFFNYTLYTPNQNNLINTGKNNDLVITGGASQSISYTEATSGPVSLGAGLAMVTTAVMTWSDYLLFNPTATTFDGYTPAVGDLIMRYGQAGDANMDGVINIDDYILIDQGYATHQPVDYTHGNFDHSGDGLVTAADYALIDYNYSLGDTLAASAEITLHTEEFGQAYINAFNAISPTPIPEPASLALLALGAAGLLRRRKR